MAPLGASGVLPEFMPGGDGRSYPEVTVGTNTVIMGRSIHLVIRDLVPCSLSVSAHVGAAAKSGMPGRHHPQRADDARPLCAWRAAAPRASRRPGAEGEQDADRTMCRNRKGCSSARIPPARLQTLIGEPRSRPPGHPACPFGKTMRGTDPLRENLRRIARPIATFPAVHLLAEAAHAGHARTVAPCPDPRRA